MRKQSFHEGQKVAHRPAFLRSVGWYFDVPRYGIVLDVSELSSETTLARVAWVGGRAPERINTANIVAYDRLHLEPR
jgi:hypothetical protein